MKRISFLAFLAASLAASVHAHESSMVSSYSRITSTDSLPNALSTTSSGSNYDFSEELTSEPFEDAFLVVSWPEIDLLSADDDDDDDSFFPEVTVQSTRPSRRSSEDTVTFASSSFGRSVPSGDDDSSAQYYGYNSAPTSLGRCDFAALECSACARCATNFDEARCICIDSDVTQDYNLTASEHDICFAIAPDVRFRGSVQTGVGNDCLAIAGRLVTSSDEISLNAHLNDGDDTLVVVEGGYVYNDVFMGDGDDMVYLKTGSTADDIYTGVGNDKLFVAPNSFVENVELGNSDSTPNSDKRLVVIGGFIAGYISMGAAAKEGRIYLTSTGFIGEHVVLDPNDNDDFYDYFYAAFATGSFIGEYLEFEGMDKGEIHFGAMLGNDFTTYLYGISHGSKTKLVLYSESHHSCALELDIGAWEITAHNRAVVAEEILIYSQSNGPLSEHVSIVAHDDVFMYAIRFEDSAGHHGDLHFYSGRNFAFYELQLGYDYEILGDVVAIFAGGASGYELMLKSDKFTHVQFGRNTYINNAHINEGGDDASLIRMAPGSQIEYLQIEGEGDAYVAGAKVSSLEWRTMSEDLVGRLFLGGNGEVGYLYDDSTVLGTVRVWVEEYSHIYEVFFISTLTECELEKEDGVLDYCVCGKGCPEVLFDDGQAMVASKKRSILKRDDVAAAAAAAEAAPRERSLASILRKNAKIAKENARLQRRIAKVQAQLQS